MNFNCGPQNAGRPPLMSSEQLTDQEINEALAKALADTYSGNTLEA